MDEYDKKFAEMQKYIPFLEAMIERLQNVKDKSREVQLQKMQSLHGILSNSKRKLRIETLQRCEDVLQKLHNRVEKGNTPGLQLPTKRNDGTFSQPSTSWEKSGESKKTEETSLSKDAEKDRFEETPASPDPSVSPDSACQILPIIIPTERSTDFTEDKGNKQQTNSKIPVITLTERTRNITTISLDSSSDDATEFTEWDMLEESERHRTKTRGNCWQSLAVSGHDVATAAKLVSSNLPQKVSDGRSYSLGSRNIPTVPVPSLGGSRRLSSVLEKSALNLNIANTSRPESPVNVPEVRLKSPDPEILFPRSKAPSPKPKDNNHASKTPTKTPTKTPMPLLVSPPPISTEPPLSMEDLAELLSEEGDVEKKGEKASEDGVRHEKDSGKPETSPAKDGKTSKSFSLAQSDVEKQNEKRWEEMDKHIVKLANRKCSSNSLETLKSSEIKGPPSFQSSNDHRSPQTSSMASKPRYADNYERHPRQRDAHSHEGAKDKPSASNNNAHRIAAPEEEMSQIQILCSTTVGGKTDERNVPLYQRRPSVLPEGRMDVASSRPDNEFVIEGIDYYNMHTNQMHWPPAMQPSAATNDHQFGNAQWTPTSVYSGMPNQSSLQSGQHPYQRPMNMFVGANSMDSHPVEPQLRQNQFPTGPRPLLNPVARSQDMNHMARPENIREDIPPLLPPGFPSYRGFPMSQGSYDPAFDRSAEYSHVRPTWEGPANRVGEATYSGENVSCGIAEGSAGTQYPRTGTPCPWPRDRDRCNRGRGGYFNDRNRTEVRTGFNARRPDWSRDSHTDRENPNRFNRDNRSVSERDPRVRTEHNATIPNQAKEHNTTIPNQQAKSNSGSARDPRLAKEKHLTPIKAKDATHNERDPRKRPVPPIISTSKKINNKEKSKSQKLPEKRIDSESSCKEKMDKSKIDRMQSPLESLYGVIDTKSSHGCGLQKFKIPKIKRSEPPLPSSTTSHVTDETKEAGGASFKLPRAKSNSKRNSGKSHFENSNKDDAVAEVSSSSNINEVTEDVDISVDSRQDDVTKEGEVLSISHIKETNRSEMKIDKIVSTAIDAKSNDIMTEKSRKGELEADSAKPKEEVTQEWIEALIRKSFECGEGKKLVEHAKLIRKLGKVLKTKKLKKIKKIIESESESSSSDKDIEPKKLHTRKRRVIVSDSSDDECLAERLGILKTSDANDEKAEEPTSTLTSTDTADPTKCSSEEKIETTFSDLRKKLARNIKSFAKKSDILSEDLSEKNNIQTQNSSKDRVMQSEKNDETSNVSTEDYNGDNSQKNNVRLGISHEKENDRLEHISNERTDIRSESDERLDSRLGSSDKKKKHDNVDRTSTEESKVADNVEQSSDHSKDQTDFTESVAMNIVDDRVNEGSNDKPKARTKRRNSLEMLQEDIREMFISDDVVSATGYRMCRLSRESQATVPGSAGTSSRTSTPTIVKKNEASSLNVPEKKSNAPVAEPSSSEVPDESVPSNTKSKKILRSRNSGESNKSKVKGKNQRKTRSQRSIPSSDSEEDQPLALRTEWMLNNTSNASNNTPSREEDREDEESNDTLRRSKRVFHKESAKEARVLVEKTDITKIDSSRVMFDSSSDESFSIDVSELAAAVDISLRPDKQSDQESVDTIASSKHRRKTVKRTNKRNSRSRRNASSLFDDKSEEGMSLTDEESVTSDISRSSSTTAGKRRSGGAARTCTKEELLSNILVGLVPTTRTTTTTTMTTTTREKSALTDKGDEADVDEDANDPSPIEANAKKSTVKKKKKKSSWQMGIVHKKKRKKNVSVGSSSKTSQIEREETNTVEANVSTNITENDPLEDNNVVMAEKISAETVDNESVNNMNVDSTVKYEETVKQSIKTDVFDVAENDTKLIDRPELSEISNAIEGVFSHVESLLSIEENKPILKMEVEEAKSMEDAVTAVAKNDTDTAKKISKESPSQIIYDERMEEVFGIMDAKRLIEYSWTVQDKYKCLLCFFVGKYIVHHYKINHPGREVLIARLDPTNATAAILDAEGSVTANLPFTETPANQICKYRCRFCCFIAEGAADVALKAFYEHCTTHTGEYRFHCNSCPYQAVAKASMRTHYYKMCRKLNDTFNDAASEDDIPKENGVYGYLCCDCNYVQLKRQNVELHVAFWHRDKTSTKILKINMSAITPENDAANSKNSQESTDAQQPFAENIKSEVSEVEDVAERKDVPMAVEMETILQTTNVTDALERQDKVDNANEERCNMQESKVEKDSSIMVKQETDERSKANQGEAEGPVSTTGNLSVFVCPPELENKEVEIQLERKKRMQEIANNIGISLNKNLSKPGLSIIDKLQDKMRTDAAVSSVTTECKESTNISEERKNRSSPLTTSIAESSKSEDSVDIKEDPLNQSIESENAREDSSSSAQQLAADNSEAMANDDADKTEIKIRDPLAIMDPSKNSESDGEISDNETVRLSPVFQSESSSEQSDTEPTDVNMILKETSSINASSSRDPMLTTIQRLAAQLQSAKSLEMPMADDVKIKSEPSVSSIPKPPKVVPIASVRHLLAKQDAKQRETTFTQRKDSSPPKNFIRFRRLSGDMLSIPAPLDNQEDTRASSTDGTQSDSAIDILQTDTEEECSFLKIENVVSLAPRSDDNETENSIVNDIRKAVEISPIKNKGISLLRRPNQPLILKKMNVIKPLANANVQPTTSESMTLIPVRSLPTPILPKSTTTTHLPVHTTNFLPIVPKPSKMISFDANKVTFPLSRSSVINPGATKTVTTVPGSSTANVNYKIVKVVRTPALIKPNDPPVAIKLKTADAYWAMLKASNLAHFYKCMGHDCRYTTDSLIMYYQHYHQHYHHEPLKQKTSPPYDFQKCPYCYMLLTDWNSIKSHLWEKHGHCRYQCGYCFYRAVVSSYVRQHQAACHPNSKFHMLVGKMGKRIPQQENINRNDYIQPFVCSHNCGKFFYVPETFAMHLTTKHLSSKPTFKCHLCSITFVTVELLVSHYKSHGFSKYQCLYCLHGTDNPNELHQHLSALHCNRLPKILERSLPPKPTRNKDVIEQLILRTFDESGKLSEEIHESNNAVDSKSDMTDTINIQVSANALNILTYPEQSSVEIALNQERIPNLLGNLSNVESNVSNVTSKQSEDASCAGIAENVSNSTDTPTTSSLQKQNLLGGLPLNNENKPSQQSEKKKLNDYATNQILHEPELELLSCMNDSNAVDPLECTEEFDCGDEFVNTNLLDNPAFLKSLTANASFSKDDIITSEDKTEDSDVEILENIENAKVAEKKDPKNDVNQTANPESSSKQETKKEEKSAACDTTDDKYTSKEVLTDSVTAQPDEPLTLADIKHTGYSGHELYKCGYEECSFATSNSASLRAHIKECIHKANNKNLYCAHCKKRFIKIGFLLEHLKAHGLKRFGCSLCKMRYAVPYQAMAHMKTKHKHPNTKLIPADPTNPSVDGLFIVQATRFGNVERKTKKRRGPKSTEQENGKTADNEKLQFSPDEIDQLPRQAIYLREVQCAMCPYTTKVRTNIIRHLQLHAKDETVPEIGPVNPVPCLDKKERMFDKMVNLASSSHQNGRMGGKPKEPVNESDEDAIPKFVPEHKRYVCSVAECNYLTVDEAMLRYHLKALHSEEPYFRCPHCPQPLSGQESQNIAIDKMGVHLKMHDTRLYKCSHCNHHHYHRHVVERHLTDKHPEKRPFVKVIRELDNTENIQQSIQEEAEEEAPDPDGNHWKCNLCDFKCAYKAEMASHAATIHDEKSQYKCSLCSFKTSGKILFEQHISSKHAYDPNVDFILVYQRIKGVNKRNAEIVEQTGQDEPFDTTPLWRRDMPRVRHIRGILLEEEEDEVSTNETSPAGSKVSLGKRRNETELTTRPAKLKTGKSASLDENRQSKEKSRRSLSCEKLSGEADAQDTRESASKSDKLTEDSKAETELNDSDVGRFGPYGKPDGNMYICTLCNQFKTKYKHDMRDHLYRELNYARWHCKACGYLSVNRNSLVQHFTKHHNGERPDHEPLSPDNAIEDWVMTLLKKQTDMIKAFQQINACKNVTTPVKTSVSGPEIINAITTKTIKQNDKRTVDLAPAITTLQNDILRDANRSIDTDDGDSRDNEDLVIDMKEDEMLEDGNNENVPENDKSFEKDEPEKPLICKHCQMKFTRLRGFKLHVQLTHLKRLGFLCPYCDRSTNSETLMRQHIRSKHPGRAEQIVHNPDAGGPELTNEFWEREYGLICPQKSRRHKRKSTVDTESNSSGGGSGGGGGGGGSGSGNKSSGDSDASGRADTQEKCETCGFTAMNYTGLKSHMRSHVPKHSIKCSYCTFSCSIKPELQEHWEINHPSIPFKVQNDGTAGPASSKKRNIDIYKDDIEEERVMSVDDVTSTATTMAVYSCFYCNLRSHSLITIKRHWSYMHKEPKGAENASNMTAMIGPFKYREQHLPVSKSPSAQNRVAQCQGWICQWCQEFCETDNDMKRHQDMYHSHLPFKFKKQQKQQQYEEDQSGQKGYVCSVCSYATISVASIRRHVVKHIDLFKCKYCDQTFSTPIRVSAHSAEKHPGLATKIESISNFDSVVESFIKPIRWSGAGASGSGGGVTNVKNERSERNRVHSANTPRPAVARKSTIKSALSYARPGPRVFKAVARKSTNPLPRHLRGGVNCDVDQRRAVKMESDEELESNPPLSYYGIPKTPVNLAKLNTYMVVGGHSMRVNCTTLAQLINIDPQVMLENVKYDSKYTTILSKYD